MKNLLNEPSIVSQSPLASIEAGFHRGKVVSQTLGKRHQRHQRMSVLQIAMEALHQEREEENGYLGHTQIMVADSHHFSEIM
jgi:hypothetical protein